MGLKGVGGLVVGRVVVVDVTGLVEGGTECWNLAGQFEQVGC